MAPSHPARCPTAIRSATPCPQGRQSAVLPAPCSTRREAHLSATLGLFAALGRPGGATALTVEEATPPVARAGPLSDREQALVSLYERVAPSVVNIYDITLQGRVQAGPQSVEQPEGNGTGFVYDARGHIVTNAHVLQNVLSGAAGKVQPGSLVARVLLLGPDGYQQAFDGVLVGVDRFRDLAVLRVDAPAAMLRPVSLGESAGLKVGQLVAAIGNPFGFDHSLTTGVVSALGRGFQSQTGSVIGGGIQTSAALNPGNSGGPLCDLSGRVVGVATAIYTNTGTSVGLGFAIPIDTVTRIVPSLIDFGRVLRPTLGIQAAPDQVSRALKVTEGVLIQSLDEGSPAAKAGLLATRRGLGGIIAGDIVVGLAGKRVRNMFDLSTTLDGCAVGDTVRVEVLRGVGQTQPQRLGFDATLEEEGA